MEQAQKTWRVLDLLKVSENLLKEKNIDNPRLNAELLLCEVLKEPRINLYLNFEKPLSEAEISLYRTYIRRRLNREPLQYILEYTEFFGMRFKITPDVLIPRPETEILAEKVIEYTSPEFINPKILEIGTGSGCISISVASKINCCIDAIDISPKALEIAKQNSETLGTSPKINFLIKNILTDFDNFNNYDIVISNPPYVSSGEMKNIQEEIKKYEPQIALTDGNEGLSFYRKIIEIFKATSPGIKLFLETGDGKKSAVEEILKSNNITDFNFYKDYHGIDRVLYINK